MRLRRVPSGHLLATAGLTAAIVAGGILATGGASALAATTAPPVESSASTPLQRPKAIRWSATSPTTHLGDRYQIAITNGATDQRLIVRVQIMDHQNHKNTVVIQEVLHLAPDEQRTLEAANTYGTANHFQTGIASTSQDLTFQVTLTDSSGQETARFNQAAFFKRTGPIRPLTGRGADPARPEAMPGHSHR